MQQPAAEPQAAVNQPAAGNPRLWRDTVTDLWHEYSVAWGPGERLTEMNRNECAALVELAARDIADQFAAMSRQCDDATGQTVKVGITLTMDRSGPTTKLEAHIKGSRKWVNIKKDTEVAQPEAELALWQEGQEARDAAAEAGTGAVREEAAPPDEGEEAEA